MMRGSTLEGECDAGSADGIGESRLTGGGAARRAYRAEQGWMVQWCEEERVDSSRACESARQ